MDPLAVEPTGRSLARLERLLRPRSIAIVGASATPGSLGQSVLTNLEDGGYRGELHLVNPKRPVIGGRPSVGSIDEVPFGIDCAVLAIPGAAVLASVRACADRGIGSAIIFSAGFAEAGSDGQAAQHELARIAREHDMVIEGPNCLGMVNYLDGIPLTFVATPPQEHPATPGAAIVSQSGALAAVIAVDMRHHGIPLTYSVSTGNEAVTRVEDYVEHLIGDPATRVFALVVEQFREPRRFLELARRARAAGQIVVLLHPGRSVAARVSAATHTGAIAGHYEVMRALVSYAGVIRVESLEELVDVTQILVRCAELPDAGAAVFTESGAFKALALDLCDQIGLPLPALSAKSEQALRQALPPFIPPSNPLDLTAQGLVDPELYRRTLPPILEDEGFGSVVLGIILTDRKTTQLKLPPIVGAIASLKPHKPVIFAALDEGAPFDFPELAQLRELGVACFPSAERALRALAHVTGRAAPAPHRVADEHVDLRVRPLAPGLVTEARSKPLLAGMGIAVPDGRLVTTVEEAIRAAAEIGYPVALKAQSSGLPHKSDVGGVMLGIGSEEDLVGGWASLHRRVLGARPDIVIDGVLVERMAAPGLEMIIGARNDTEWGPVLMVGLGGVLAEAMDDVLLLPPDLPAEAMARALYKLRCSVLLRGFRGSPPLDVGAIADVLRKVGSLVRSLPEIAELDINPLVVYEQDKGVLALDALISVALNKRAG